jgi:mono/diheme cytochrome c family protein
MTLGELGKFLIAGGLLLAGPAVAQTRPGDEFAQSIRPVLAQNCSACHNPANPKNRINFLKANTVQDIESDRGLWRDVAAQLRNRTMPPVETKLTEEERLRVSTWIDKRLQQTACAIGDYAGAVALRRLNRREYHNTVRDLLGVDFNVSELFPADGTGGAGFDTNGETLFIPPLLMERYLEAAQEILDRVIVTPNLSKTLTASQLLPAAAPAASAAAARELVPGQELTALVSIYLEGDYDVRVAAEQKDGMGTLALKVDGGTSVPLVAQQQGRGGRGQGQGQGRGGRGGGRGPALGLQVRLARGQRSLSIVADGAPVPVASLTIQQKAVEPSAEKLALHYRLMGTEPGAEPLQSRKAAEQILRAFVRKAYRRPIETADITPLMTLYDRAAQRGDPFEERVKLALKGVLVGPDFLFKLEHRSDKPGIYPIGQYELASRLSYFLWSTMPDEELDTLAAQGRLQDPKVLSDQVERMLDDPKSQAFASTFIGQWLGTQDLGGRAAPMLTELNTFYTPPVAADLRAEPILIFERILGENRSLLELLTADYTYMTNRLVKFYQLEDKFKDFNSDEPKLVEWPDNRRAGIMNLGAVMAITSHYRQTSPVLRGAWVLDTLLGTPVPPPPPNVPQLEAVKCDDNCAVTAKTAVGMRQTILAHRANPSCAACHQLMDPMGFALENFDWTGRWRDKEFDGSAIDASGSLPSGEKFNGPAELRQVLLGKKDDFLRQLTGKVLGYALGRSLQDGDSCTVQHLAQTLEKDNYRARTLIREIVLSIPFRNSQGGHVTIEEPPPPPKRVTQMVIK